MFIHETWFHSTNTNRTEFVAHDFFMERGEADARGIIHIGFYKNRQTINGNCYAPILDRLNNKTASILSHEERALPLNTMHEMKLVEPYSPDLSVAIFSFS